MDEKALQEAVTKWRKLRLTDVGGRKEHPAETVLSVFKRGLDGLFDDDAIVFVLQKGIEYYRAAEQRNGAESGTCPVCAGYKEWSGFEHMPNCPACHETGHV